MATNRKCSKCGRVGHTKPRCGKINNDTNNAEHDDDTNVELHANDTRRHYVNASTIIDDQLLMMPGARVDGFDYAVGDCVIMGYPWLDYDVVAKIRAISQASGNVWLIDEIRCHARGYNFITGPMKGVTIRPYDMTKKRKRKKNKMSREYVTSDIKIPGSDDIDIE